MKYRIIYKSTAPGCGGRLAKVFAILILGYYTFFYPLTEYDRTLVVWYIPVLAGCTVGVVVAAFMARPVKKFLAIVLVVAFIFNSVLFFLNDVFSDGKMMDFKVGIQAKYNHYGKYGPQAMVTFRDKKLSVSAASDEELKQASYAVITIDKGLFGYYIIRGQRLVK